MFYIEMEEKMESLKQGIFTMIGVILLLAMGGGVYYIVFCQSTFYYTQVDNSKIEQISETDDMKFEYSLTAYNSSGRKKEVKFKTRRELREGAFLKLEMMTIVGVKEWQEVQMEELPEKVKMKYQ